jgi:glutamyl-tRNA reductase
MAATSNAGSVQLIDSALHPHQLGMVGTTIARSGQAALSRYLLDAAPAANAALRDLQNACGLSELVYLATCNRVEFIFTRPATLSVAHCRLQIHQFFAQRASLSAPQAKASAPAGRPDWRAAGAALHAYEQEGAAEHLFEVAASLDSMNPGEAQILGQVKAAYAAARAADLAGSRLSLVFEEAFAAAKRVRRETHLGKGVVSMVSLAKEVLEQSLQPSAPRATLAVIGVGEMAQQCGMLFHQHPHVTLLFVNRTVARAQPLAQQFGGTAVSLAAFLQAPPPVQAVVTATSAPQPFLDAAFFARLPAQPRPVCVVDLAVGRDADPSAAARYGVALYDLDRLGTLSAQAQEGRLAQVAPARRLLDEALLAYRRRLTEQQMAPVVRLLRDWVQAEVDQACQALLSRILPAQEKATQQKIDAWGRTAAAQLAHAPTVGLKKLAFIHGMEAVATFVTALQLRRSVDAGRASPAPAPGAEAHFTQTPPGSAQEPDPS